MLDLISTVKSSLARCSFSMTIMDHNSAAPLQMSAEDHVRHVTFPLRLMRSHGQLSRSWNEALTSGFVNLEEPVNDYVVLIQADAKLQPGWWNFIQPRMEDADMGCDFLQMGRGDEFMVFTPTAVKRVGLFDETYTGIQYHEFDYFSRARACITERSCLHDHHGVGYSHMHRPWVNDWRTITNYETLAGSVDEAVSNVLDQEVPNGGFGFGEHKTLPVEDHSFARYKAKFPSEKDWMRSKDGEEKRIPKCCSGQSKLYTPFEYDVDTKAYSPCH